MFDSKENDKFDQGVKGLTVSFIVFINWSHSALGLFVRTFHWENFP